MDRRRNWALVLHGHLPYVRSSQPRVPLELEDCGSFQAGSWQCLSALLRLLDVGLPPASTREPEPQPLGSRPTLLSLTERMRSATNSFRSGFSSDQTLLARRPIPASSWLAMCPWLSVGSRARSDWPSEAGEPARLCFRQASAGPAFSNSDLGGTTPAPARRSARLICPCLPARHLRAVQGPAAHGADSGSMSACSASGPSASGSRVARTTRACEQQLASLPACAFYASCSMPRPALHGLPRPRYGNPLMPRSTCFASRGGLPSLAVIGQHHPWPRLVPARASTPAAAPYR